MQPTPMPAHMGSISRSYVGVPVFRAALSQHRDWTLRRSCGATIATLMIGNHERGFAEAIAWVAEHAPGPRVVVGLEGTRSYGIGLARVVQAAGLTVVETESPRPGG